MSDTMELKELLAAIEAAGDLRKEETQRLIGYTEKVLLEIARTAEKGDTSVSIRIEVDEQGEELLFSVRPLEGVRGVWAALLENEYNGKEYLLMATKPEGLILHDIPRRTWIAVAKNIGLLVQRLKEKAEREVRETKEAADLVERMASVL